MTQAPAAAGGGDPHHDGAVHPDPGPGHGAEHDTKKPTEPGPLLWGPGRMGSTYQ